jgi:transcriptional regulator with XRE-family HTH domain
MPFGSTLKAARIKAGLTLRKLGDAVNYPFNALSEIENGTRRVPINTPLLEKLAQILALNLNEARKELATDENKRMPLRVESLLRNNEEFALEFYCQTNKLSDEELLSLLRNAIENGKTT